jgi:hypothetical protein
LAGAGRFSGFSITSTRLEVWWRSLEKISGGNIDRAESPVADAREFLMNVRRLVFMVSKNQIVMNRYFKIT